MVNFNHQFHQKKKTLTTNHDLVIFQVLDFNLQSCIIYGLIEAFRIFCSYLLS